MGRKQARRLTSPDLTSPGAPGVHDTEAQKRGDDQPNRHHVYSTTPSRASSERPASATGLACLFFYFIFIHVTWILELLKETNMHMQERGQGLRDCGTSLISQRFGGANFFTFVDKFSIYSWLRVHPGLPFALVCRHSPCLIHWLIVQYVFFAKFASASFLPQSLRLNTMALRSGRQGSHLYVWSREVLKKKKNSSSLLCMCE